MEVAWNFFSNDFAYKIWYENYKDTFKMNLGKIRLRDLYGKFLRLV